MYITNPTWNDLLLHIQNMSEEERNSPVVFWGEDIRIGTDISICVDNEDNVYDPEEPYDGCCLRSDYDGECDEDDLVTILEAGKTYLYIG